MKSKHGSVPHKYSLAMLYDSSPGLQGFKIIVLLQLCYCHYNAYIFYRTHLFELFVAIRALIVFLFRHQCRELELSA